MLSHNLPRDPGDNLGLAVAAPLVRGLEPIPAPRAIGGNSLLGIDHYQPLLLGQKVDSRSGGEIIRALGAAVEHHDQGPGLTFIATGEVQFVGTVASLSGIRFSYPPAAGGEY